MPGPSAWHGYALAITLLAEGGGMLVCSLAIPSQRARATRNVATAIVLNLVSHTVFWLGLPLLPLEGTTRLYVAELIVVAAEAAAYQKLLSLPPTRVLALSGLLNLSSFALGILCWTVLR
jgi:hypothetical protein